VSTSVKEDVLFVYESLGGASGLEEWARESKRNLALFYQWMMTKLLPASLDVDQKSTVKFEPLQVIINSNGDSPPK